VLLKKISFNIAKSALLIMTALLLIMIGKAYDLAWTKWVVFIIFLILNVVFFKTATLVKRAFQDSE
jgi:hypothetical protein